MSIRLEYPLNLDVLNVSVLIRCLTEQQLTAVYFLVLGIDRCVKHVSICLEYPLNLDVLNVSVVVLNVSVLIRCLTEQLTVV